MSVCQRKLRFVLSNFDFFSSYIIREEASEIFNGWYDGHFIFINNENWRFRLSANAHSHIILVFCVDRKFHSSIGIYNCREGSLQNLWSLCNKGIWQHTEGCMNFSRLKDHVWCIASTFLSGCVPLAFILTD